MQKDIRVSNRPTRQYRLRDHARADWSDPIPMWRLWFYGIAFVVISFVALVLWLVQ